MARHHCVPVLCVIASLGIAAFVWGCGGDTVDDAIVVSTRPLASQAAIADGDAVVVTWDSDPGVVSDGRGPLPGSGNTRTLTVINRDMRLSWGDGTVEILTFPEFTFAVVPVGSTDSTVVGWLDGEEAVSLTASVVTLQFSKFIDEIPELELSTGGRPAVGYDHHLAAGSDLDVHLSGMLRRDARYTLSGTVVHDTPRGFLPVAFAESFITASETAEERTSRTMAGVVVVEDNVTGITWYNPRSSYVGGRFAQVPLPRGGGYFVFAPYLGERDGNVWMRLKITYRADDWLFIDRIYTVADGHRWNRRIDFDDVDRDVDRGGIYEWIDLPVGGLFGVEEDELRRMSDASDVTLRLSGDWAVDLTLTSDQKRGIGEALDVYALLAE